MKWKKVINGIAPTIATALGGPMAGTAVKYLSSQLLGYDNATEQELEKAIIGADPETLARIKETDNNFKVEMERLNVDLHQMAVDDRISARKLATDTTLLPQSLLTAIFVLGYFGLMYMLFSGMVKLDNSIRDMSNILLGVLTAGIPMILKFWFGGSPHDDKNLDKIYNSIPK